MRAIDFITDNRYNSDKEIFAMSISDLLKQKNLTKYKLSKLSGVPFSTISDISTGKARIEKCSAETLYKLAKTLNVTMEDLVADSVEYRPDFSTYKSNICHMVKDMGDINFIIDVLESGKIRRFYQKRWYLESLYLLAMVDYLSRENDLPVCSEYDDIRAARFREPIYPEGVLMMSALLKSDKPKIESAREAIPEFMRAGIMESEVRNVY
jgi:transcriptional regulator with XRE-family HTH domain